MPALPGQRAAQTPAQAAVASSRAMGQLARTTGVLCSHIGVTLHGRRWEQTTDPDTAAEAWTDTTTGRTYPTIPDPDQLTEGDA